VTLARQPAPESRAAALLGLQRTVGNRASTRMIQLARGATGQGKGSAGFAAGATATSASVAPGAGRPLDAGTRARMEPHLGADFGSVLIHTDAAAGRLSRMLGAQAFTAGRHIFFAPGAYNPASLPGRRLLAHELAHVVQQAGTGPRALTLSEPGDPAEQEADRVGESVAMAQDAAPGTGPAPPAPLAGHQSSGDAVPIVQRRLIATGDIRDIVDFIFLVGPAIGLELVHDPATNEITSIGPGPKPATSLELRALLTTIMNDQARNAELLIGKGQPTVLGGAFPQPRDLTAGRVQQIDIDDILNIEAGAPGNGLAALAHEIAENYHAHSLAVVAGTDRFPESHRAGLEAERRVASELVGRGGRVATVATLVGARLTIVLDYETYFLVMEVTQDPVTLDARVLSARQAPRVAVSTHRFDGFQIGVAAVPAGASATIAAVVADLAANPTATVRIQGFTDLRGPFAADLARSREWAHLTRDAIEATAAIGPDGYNLIGLGAMSFVAPNTTEPNRRQNRRVVITLERPGP
jgi:outer membrane protein OmpA-like peptidoglycan-associated protein